MRCCFCAACGADFRERGWRWGFRTSSLSLSVEGVEDGFGGEVREGWLVARPVAEQWFQSLELFCLSGG